MEKTRLMITCDQVIEVTLEKKTKPRFFVEPDYRTLSTLTPVGLEKIEINSEGHCTESRIYVFSQMLLAYIVDPNRYLPWQEIARFLADSKIDPSKKRNKKVPLPNLKAVRTCLADLNRGIKSKFGLLNNIYGAPPGRRSLSYRLINLEARLLKRDELDFDFLNRSTHASKSGEVEEEPESPIELPQNSAPGHDQNLNWEPKAGSVLSGPRDNEILIHTSNRNQDPVEGSKPNKKAFDVRPKTRMFDSEANSCLTEDRYQEPPIDSSSPQSEPAHQPNATDESAPDYSGQKKASEAESDAGSSKPGNGDQKVNTAQDTPESHRKNSSAESKKVSQQSERYSLRKTLMDWNGSNDFRVKYFHWHISIANLLLGTHGRCPELEIRDKFFRDYPQYRSFSQPKINALVFFYLSLYGQRDEINKRHKGIIRWEKQLTLDRIHSIQLIEYCIGMMYEGTENLKKADLKSLFSNNLTSREGSRFCLADFELYIAQELVQRGSIYNENSQFNAPSLQQYWYAIESITRDLELFFESQDRIWKKEDKNLYDELSRSYDHWQKDNSETDLTVFKWTDADIARIVFPIRYVRLLKEPFAHELNLVIGLGSLLIMALHVSMVLRLGVGIIASSISGSDLLILYLLAQGFWLTQHKVYYLLGRFSERACHFFFACFRKFHIRTRKNEEEEDFEIFLKDTKECLEKEDMEWAKEYVYDRIWLSYPHLDYQECKERMQPLLQAYQEKLRKEKKTKKKIDPAQGKEEHDHKHQKDFNEAQEKTNSGLGEPPTNSDGAQNSGNNNQDSQSHPHSSGEAVRAPRDEITNQKKGGFRDFVAALWFPFRQVRDWVNRCIERHFWLSVFLILTAYITYWSTTPYQLFSIVKNPVKFIQGTSPFWSQEAQLNILILPFALHDDCTNREIDIPKILKARFLEMAVREEIPLGVKIFPGTTTFTTDEARQQGENQNAHLVLKGEYFEHCENDSIDVSISYEVIPEWLLFDEFLEFAKCEIISKSGTSAVEQIRLSHLRTGQVQEDVDYIIYWFFGIIALANEDEVKAEQYFRKCLDIKESDGAYLYLALILNEQQNRHREAEVNARNFIQYNPKNVLGLVILAEILEYQALFDEAEATYLQAIQLTSDNTKLWDELGDFYMRRNHYDSADYAYEQSQKIQPMDLWKWMDYGDFLQAQKRYEKAKAAYERAIEINPSHAYAWVRLGDVLVNLDQVEQAEAAYDRALEIDPNTIIVSRIFVP